MTLIKPVKGLDDAMEESFRSIVAADPLKTLQVIVALESEEDPACPVARAFAAAHPDRDILVAITGPSGPRMGKIHNMIEACRARSTTWSSSPTPTPASRGLCSRIPRPRSKGRRTRRTAMPYHVFSPGLGGLWFQIAFNHSFCVPVALSYEHGQLHAFAGAWMGYTKKALARIGGLERFENVIADDYSLGAAARAAGLRQVLLREPVLVSETGTAPGQAFTHIAKWRLDHLLVVSFGLCPRRAGESNSSGVGRAGARLGAGTLARSAGGRRRRGAGFSRAGRPSSGPLDRRA